MKKVMKIVGIVILVIIVLVALLLIKGALTPAVPKNYTETVKTGGEIEAELWRQQVQDAFSGFHVIYDMLSCSVACHTGIGAVGLGISQVLNSEAEI